MAGFHRKKVSAAKHDTPGKNSESDASNCSDKFPQKYWNFPKFASNIGAFPNLPQILELSQICFRIIRVSSRSPSFHILRFKRAAQLRPSHKGCGRENFLNFGFGFKNDQMLFCISGGKQRNTSVRFPNCHNASGLGNLNRKY